MQDRGRPGWAHLGVARSGALDRPAADLANRLVGNDGSAAVLETTLGGVVFAVSEATTVAVTGAECPVRLGERAVAFAEPVGVPAGATLTVGRATRGVRSYVALAGGIDVPEVLGSRSTDLLAHLGPPVVGAGDVLVLGGQSGPPSGADVGSVRRFVRPASLRLQPGPREDWFHDASLDALTSTPYVVAGESNRVGLRLDGAPLSRRRDGELPSEGIVLGAVQVPPAGQPLVFLADHPTTGGYPVVAVVEPDDLWQCAQLRPGRRSGSHVGDGGGARRQRRVVHPERAHRPRAGLGGLEAHRHATDPRAPDPARAVLGVHHVHARGPRTGAGDRLDGVVGQRLVPVRRVPRLVVDSANRSSWIQSASPETPTPSSRTPPEVSTSLSSVLASRATTRVSSVGAGSVEERVWVVKSWSRIFTVTVRPDIRALRSRSATWLACRSTSPSSSRLSTRSVS